MRKKAWLSALPMALLWVWGMGVAGGEQKSLTATQLIRNLEHREFSGSPLSICLNGAPIRNLFEAGHGPIPPVFPTQSGLTFVLDADLDMAVSIRSDGEPWDRVLWKILEAHHLRAMLRGDKVLITRKSGEPAATAPVAPPAGQENFKAPSLPAGPPANKQDRKVPGILKGVNRPESLQVHGERLFVVDGLRVLIFSLRDLSVIRVLGKTGQGPGEFTPYPEIQDQGSIRLTLRRDGIWVGSRNKVSRFTMAGDFDRDVSMRNPAACGVLPFGEGFAGFEVFRFPRWRHDFYLYSPAKGGKVKLISVAKAIHTEKALRRGPKMVFRDLLYCGPEYRVSGDHLYVLGREGMFLDLFNPAGQRVKVIRCDFQSATIGAAERNKILALYRQRMRSIWPRARKVIAVPGATPRFRTFRLTGNRIYVQTYVKEKAGTVFYVLSADGKQRRRLVVPLAYRDFLTPYPYAIAGNVLYTAVEDEESGDWRLQRTPLE